MVMVMLTGQAMPLLLKLSDVSRVIVYDAGNSQLVADWGKSDQYQLIAVESRQELDEYLVSMNSQMLGLVIPADFDHSPSPELGGYIVWSAR